jgi:hypothetical protein
MFWLASIAKPEPVVALPSAPRTSIDTTPCNVLPAAAIRSAETAPPAAALADGDGWAPALVCSRAT